jgi:hypothetical protein
LPNSEFIELYNRSNKTYNLEGFKFINGSVSTELPYFLLKPKNFVTIYTRKSTVNFGIYGDTMPVTKLISLSNPFDTFYLKNPQGAIIDVATYDLSFYQNPKKNDGGWSLERMNPNAPCQTEGWIASNDLKGGTPSKPNSVLIDSLDKSQATVLSTFPKDDNTIVLKFDKAIERNLTSVLNQITISNSLKINSLKLIEPDFKTLELNLNTKMILKTKYQIVVKNTLRDCQNTPPSVGNVKNDTLTIQMPEKPIANDLIINELLYNPETGGARFIEIFNRSEKPVDVFNIKIADLKTGDVKTIGNHFVLYPKAYLCLTEDIFYLQKRYKSADFKKSFLKNKLPTWNDKAGNAAIYMVDGSKTVILDSFNYDNAFHNPLLAVTEGVSLERINPDAPTYDKNNWHSAAESVHFATPGYQNSQFRVQIHRDSTSKTIFSLSHNTFSPDGDGYQDFLQIDYKTDASDYLATLSIFDISGRYIKTIAYNQLLDNEGFMSWSGELAQGVTAPKGIYIIHCQIVSSKGKVLEQTLTCAITGGY